MIEFVIINKAQNCSQTGKSMRVDSTQIYSRGLHGNNFYGIIGEGKIEMRNWLVFSGTCKCTYGTAIIVKYPPNSFQTRFGRKLYLGTMFQ